MDETRDSLGDEYSDDYLGDNLGRSKASLVGKVGKRVLMLLAE